MKGVKANLLWVDIAESPTPVRRGKKKTLQWYLMVKEVCSTYLSSGAVVLLHTSPSAVMVTWATYL